jgi:TonB family protein
MKNFTKGIRQITAVLSVFVLLFTTMALKFDNIPIEKTAVIEDDYFGLFVGKNHQMGKMEINEIAYLSIIEDVAQFPGGEEARIAFLTENLKFPIEARKAGIKGTVFVSFIVERDGSITNVEVVRGIGFGCDEEAIRVTQLMPKWIPGKQINKPVRTFFRMPIRFNISCYPVYLTF